MPTNPSALQRAASRANGSRSRGPLTRAGKARSSRNALRHGARAVVHSPDGEDPQRRQELQVALANRLQPSGAGEMELVERLTVDFMRLERIEVAEAAACDLEQLRVQRSDQDNRHLVFIQEHLPVWQHIRGGATHIQTWLSRKGERLAAMEELRTLRDAIHLAVAELDPIDTTIDGGEEIVALAARVRHERMTGEDRCRAIVEAADLVTRYLEALREKILTTETQRHEAERTLATIPDERSVKRLNTYRATVERSLKRRFEILGMMRQLGAPRALE